MSEKIDLTDPMIKNGSSRSPALNCHFKDKTNSGGLTPLPPPFLFTTISQKLIMSVSIW